MVAQKEVLCSPSPFISFTRELCYNHCLKSEYLAPVGKFESYDL